jgi:glutathione S-transferase
MKLYQSPNSPFVRKVLVTANELGLDDRIERIAATPHPIRRNMELVALNPLGQIPTLVIDGGERISDSRVICEYLASLAPGQKMFPAGPRRGAALTEQAICDGLLAACLSIRYERSTRPEALQSQEWIGGQMARIESVLDALDRRWENPPEGFDIGHVSVACSIGYLGFRFPEIAIAPRWANLARWWETAGQRPALQATIPPG